MPFQAWTEAFETWISSSETSPRRRQTSIAPFQAWSRLVEVWDRPVQVSFKLNDVSDEPIQVSFKLNEVTPAGPQVACMMVQARHALREVGNALTQLSDGLNQLSSNSGQSTVAARVIHPATRGPGGSRLEAAERVAHDLFDALAQRAFGGAV